ncbi:MAG: GH23 [uncultured Gemmatimonadetes bacterium]|uniref:GH23 n=1 Tax=uncultured Gemmatimonadota bacterium TaxID=203437 RepID=A0A6J4K735_9BACT|nr:MAG: GH23 [uncultured Gemmatimonadota bacterium]
MPPRSTAKKPSIKKPAARKPSRRAPAKRARGRRFPWSWVLVALVVFVAANPTARRITWEAVLAARAALESARAAQARERQADDYARRYGIDRSMAAAVLRAADAEGVRTELAFRLVRVESAFRPRAVSPVGALGLTQLMPATAAELQPGVTREELFDRDTNLRLGFRYFRRLLRAYDGDVEAALHAYNRGPGTVNRIRRAGGDPANGYAKAVLGRTGASPVGPPPPVRVDTTPASPPLPTIDGIAPTPMPVGH